MKGTQLSRAVQLPLAGSCSTAVRLACAELAPAHALPCLRLACPLLLPVCRSWLTWGYLGWRGLAAVFAFFWAAGLAQRCATDALSSRHSSANVHKVHSYHLRSPSTVSRRVLPSISPCTSPPSNGMHAAPHSCRLAVAPVARLVFGQEQREGDLRFAHLRLRWA